MKTEIRKILLVLSLVMVATFAISITIAKPNGEPPGTWKATPPIHIHKGATSSPTGYSPGQIRHAYGFDGLTNCVFGSASWPNSNLCGNGQTIAIVDAFNDPSIESDLATFSSTYGLPPCTKNNGCLVVTKQGNPRFDPGWALEISLDVEWAHAIAPGAKILLVEARSNSLNNLLGAVYSGSHTVGVHQVSMSWGGGEPSNELSLDTYFQVPGVSFFASSGDNGVLEWPAASPYVIGVGGTTLPLDSSGNLLNPETAWSGSGGGTSCCEPLPGYQSTFGITDPTRAVPDVSYIGDPATGVSVFDSSSYGGGWFDIGGTSVGSPQWSSTFAIVNSKRTGYLSTINPSTSAAYTAATGSNYANNYRDIISGSNSGFSAGPGYDLVTGLGSPLANNLIPYLQSLP